MRVCVVGSGGREHALAAALARTASVVVAPGTGTPTGTVNFIFDGGATVVSGVALDPSGQATYSTNALTVAGSPHMNAVRLAASMGDRPFIWRRRYNARVAGGCVIDVWAVGRVVTDVVGVTPDAPAGAAATGRADEAR